MTSTGAAAGFFQGVVDEARIWNVARSQAQIQAAKDTDIAAPQTGLIGHWGLNEGAGAIANNTFGTADVNGTLTASPDLGQRVRAARAPNGAPTIGLVAPADAATGLSTSPELSATADRPREPAGHRHVLGPALRQRRLRRRRQRDRALGPDRLDRLGRPGGGQRYEWYAVASDGSQATTSPTWTFNTAPGADPVLVGAGDIAGCSSGGDELTGRSWRRRSGERLHAGR